MTCWGRSIGPTEVMVNLSCKNTREACLGTKRWCLWRKYSGAGPPMPCTCVVRILRQILKLLMSCGFACAFQQRIDQALDKMDSKDINERRRGDLDKFLTTTNTKAAVFRDIIIESGILPETHVRRMSSTPTKRVDCFELSHMLAWAPIVGKQKIRKVNSRQRPVQPPDHHNLSVKDVSTSNWGYSQLLVGKYLAHIIAYGIS